MKQNNFIRNLSNSDLWSQTKTAARDEKAATLLLLDYLAEVERRRLFAERAYSSLFEFVMKELGYSESQTSERINAMRLMKEIPIVKEHIQTGDLSLTTASKIQRFIKSEKKITGKKINFTQTMSLISACQNKSKREIEKIMIQKSSAPLKALTELKISVEEEVRDNKTNKRCESIFRLQFEHQIPFSVGGKTNTSNLLHYCPAHNQLSAIQFFGKSKMNRFYEVK